MFAVVSELFEAHNSEITIVKYITYRLSLYLFVLNIISKSQIIPLLIGNFKIWRNMTISICLALEQQKWNSQNSKMVCIYRSLTSYPNLESFHQCSQKLLIWSQFRDMHMHYPCWWWGNNLKWNMQIKTWPVFISRF